MKVELSMTDNLSNEFTNLTTEEKKIALKILQEYAENGKSSTYNLVILSDYEEIPVSINEFLHNPVYLGKGLTDSEGRFTLFPYWEKTLNKIFPDPLKPAQYNTLALSGAIGIGKSTEAVIIGCYELYRMLCLKDPYLHYGLLPIDLITFAVINITMDAAEGVAWSKMQALIQSSSWFMARGSMTKGDTPLWKPPKGIELIYGSLSRHIIGRAVYFAFFDEISFQINLDINKQKEKAKLLVNTAAARMQSRFMRGTSNPTILVLASSKRTDLSYMESFIEGKKKNESKTTLIIDEPQWVIRTDKDSKEKFKVALGNKFLDSEVVPLNATEQDLQAYRDRGYILLDVPIGYYESFIDDIDIALTDIAGISTSNTTRYIAGNRIAAIKSNDILNLFVKDVIEVGNAKDDNTLYYDFIDLNRLDRKMLSKPLYIHLDMSISGDKTGIAGVWIKGKKSHIDGEPENKDLYYLLAFSVSVKAPKGYQISFEKNRLFIRWLKSLGFAIKVISSDTFLSADLLLQLSAENFKTEIISVDRVQDRLCIPYQVLKSAIYEERVKMYEAPLLTEELIGLERDNNGKIDHTPAGINCFTGDTLILMLDGSSKTMLELLNDFNNNLDNYVYSFNHEKQIIEPKKILKVFKSGENARLVKVTLDNGETIRCTPEHRFMLRDGSYVEAANLIPMQSLMPLYTKYPKEGLTNYRLYYEPMENKWHYEHRRFAVEVYDEKYLVHHKDCNPRNNAPSNLIWMSKSAHIIEHSRLQTGAQSIEAKLKRANGLVIKYYYECIPGYKEHIAQQVSINHKKGAYKNAEEALSDRIWWTNGKLGKENNLYLKLNDVPLEGFRRGRTLKNHKVISVEFIEDTEDVYDIEVEDNHNFALASGVFVHNSKDQADGFCLHPDTEIFLLSGKHKTIKLLYENYDNEWVLAYNTESNKLEPVKIQSVINNGYKDNLIKLTLDNGKSLICTEDHKILTRNSEYKDAKDCLNESLMPFNYENRLINDILKLGFCIYNHRVINIEKVSGNTVYDLKLDKIHNFALTSGIFVHNCGALYSASKHAEEYAFEFGDDIEAAISVSQNNTLNKNQMITDFEKELLQIANPFNTSNKNLKLSNNSSFIDFGLGTAKPLVNDPFYVMNGIIL